MGNQYTGVFFSAMLNYRTLNVTSKVFVGVLLNLLAVDRIQTENGWKEVFNKQKYFEVIEGWLNTGSDIWRRMSQDNIQQAINTEINTMCFENIDHNLADYLHNNFSEYQPYLGAIEVDDASRIHWELYSHSLIPKYRILNKKLNLFWDGYNEETKDSVNGEPF